MCKKEVDLKKFKELSFGTSGLRDTVENMTDMECYINTRGFLRYLSNSGEFNPGDTVALGGDRRQSTLRIKRAVAAAVQDMGGIVEDQGLTPSPALAYYAIAGGMPGIMVTGSHIPADRNGIKFTKKSGEVLKNDEKEILANVKEEREQVYSSFCKDGSPFNHKGMLNDDYAKRAEKLLHDKEYTGEAVNEYIKRYIEVFSHISSLSGKRIFFYQHSAVGRDIIKEIFERLGAEVIAPEDSVEITYTDEDGQSITNNIPLRSKEFVAVDTESVSLQTLAIFRNMMNKYDADIGITVDGDSDRPLLVYRVPTTEVNYVTGDILGILALLGLKSLGVDINAACVPVSANDAVASVCKEKGIELTLTKIGSPYVITAMNDSLKNHLGDKFPVWNVFSWEANGGFLTGNDIAIQEKVLKALPTRDAMLPLILVINLICLRNITIPDLLSELPPRFTFADRKKEFPVEKSRAIINFISPKNTGDVKEVIFSKNGREASTVTFENRISDNIDENELLNIKKVLENVFTAEDGFSGISKINYLDGVRIYFDNGEISHLRPSGNAPEFRNYAIADSPKRAKEIVRLGIEKFIPELAAAIRDKINEIKK